MRRLIPLLVAAGLAAPAATASAASPPPKRANATGFGGAAATVDPYATRAAIDVLRRGGNAIDAAIAAAGVLGVVEPYSSGIGGGGFMVIRTAGGNLTTIDGRETAPAAFTEDAFTDAATGEPIGFEEAVTSGLGVGVPGTLRTWQTALSRFGTVQLRRLLRPGIRLARNGFVVDETLQTQTEDNAERFADFPATARIYLPGGEPIQAGTRLRNPALARTLARVGRRGVARGFYRGKVARQIVDAVRAPKVRDGAERTVRPGVMTAADLRAYRARRRAPAISRYRGLRVAGMPPPSSGATTIGETLNIIEALGRPAPQDAQVLHRFLEASRLAYADRGAYLGDPDQISVPVECLLSQDFANARAGLITDAPGTSPAPAGTCPQAEPAPASTAAEGPNTTHLTVADGRGNVVAYTFTIEQTGGSGMVVPRRGFLLNNELTDFDFTPGLPNSPAAGKRPRSSMAPTIVLRGRRPVLALGSPGGSSIITTVGQILVNRFERGLDLRQAIAAPRVSQRNSPESQAEPAFVASPEGQALAAIGHTFSEIEELGAATAIQVRRGGRLEAAAEPQRRGGGSAAAISRRR